MLEGEGLSVLIPSYRAAVQEAKSYKAADQLPELVFRATQIRVQISHRLTTKSPDHREAGELKDADEDLCRFVSHLTRRQLLVKADLETIRILDIDIREPGLKWLFGEACAPRRIKLIAVLQGLAYAGALIEMISIFQKLSGGLSDVVLTLVTTVQVALGAFAGKEVIDSFKNTVRRAQNFSYKALLWRTLGAQVFLLFTMATNRIAIPKFALIAYNHGGNLEMHADIDDALNYFRMAESLDPSQANYHYDVAWILYNTGDLEKAKSEYTSAITVDPKHSKSWLDLANLELDQKNYLAALADLQATKTHLTYTIEVPSILGGDKLAVDQSKTAINDYVWNVYEGQALMGLNYYSSALSCFQQAKASLEQAYRLTSPTKVVEKPTNGFEKFEDGGFRACVGIARAAEKLRNVSMSQEQVLEARRLIGPGSPMANLMNRDPFTANRFFDAPDVLYVEEKVATKSILKKK
jgi:tetratricopeptide (TPR) repeat protein